MLRTTGSKRISVVIQDRKGQYLVVERADAIEEPLEFPGFSCKDANMPEGDEGMALVTNGIKDLLGINIKDVKLIETFYDEEYPFYHYIQSRWIFWKSCERILRWNLLEKTK